MSLQVGLDAAAVKVFPKLRTQHVQNPTALGIREITKHVMRVIIVSPYDGIYIIGNASDLPGASVKLIQHVVATIFMFVVESFVISCEAFVQPDMAPILAGDEVAEPLMCHF